MRLLTVCPSVSNYTMLSNASVYWFYGYKALSNKVEYKHHSCGCIDTINLILNEKRIENRFIFSLCNNSYILYNYFKQPIPIKLNCSSSGTDILNISLYGRFYFNYTKISYIQEPYTVCSDNGCTCSCLSYTIIEPIIINRTVNSSLLYEVQDKNETILLLKPLLSEQFNKESEYSLILFSRRMFYRFNISNYSCNFYQFNLSVDDYGAAHISLIDNYSSNLSCLFIRNKTIPWPLQKDNRSSSFIYLIDKRFFFNSSCFYGNDLFLNYLKICITPNNYNLTKITYVPSYNNEINLDYSFFLLVILFILIERILNEKLFIFYK